jgi:hypothetical protein
MMRQAPAGTRGSFSVPAHWVSELKKFHHAVNLLTGYNIVNISLEVEGFFTELIR